MSDPHLLELLSLDTHLPFANVFSSADPRLLAAYHWQSWHTANCITANEGAFEAVCLYQDLPWDSKLLDVPAARILYSNALRPGADREAIVHPDRAQALRTVLAEFLDRLTSRGIGLIDARVSTQDLFIARA